MGNQLIEKDYTSTAGAATLGVGNKNTSSLPTMVLKRSDTALKTKQIRTVDVVAAPPSASLASLRGTYENSDNEEDAFFRGDNFIAVPAFAGAHNGYKFTTGNQGTGYYRDAQSEAEIRAEAEAATAEFVAARAAAVAKRAATLRAAEQENLTAVGGGNLDVVSAIGARSAESAMAERERLAYASMVAELPPGMDPTLRKQLEEFVSGKA